MKNCLTPVQSLWHSLKIIRSLWMTTTIQPLNSILKRTSFVKCILPPPLQKTKLSGAIEYPTFASLCQISLVGFRNPQPCSENDNVALPSGINKTATYKPVVTRLSALHLLPAAAIFAHATRSKRVIIQARRRD